MIQFLKRLFAQRSRDITLIMLDDSRPGEDESFNLRPASIFRLAWLIAVVIVIIITAVFMITPLGSMLYTREDKIVREQIEQISERIAGLQDSLETRNKQLSEMKDIIRLSVDTTFSMDRRFSAMFEQEPVETDFMTVRFEEPSMNERVGTTGILMSNIFKSSPDFPASYPVQGTLTRDYEPEEFHFGMDIATREDAPVMAIADGTVINATWTISDGFVITIQHSGGITTQYKHCASVNKKNGDVVLKGDIIGTSGDVGISSTGPHLHFEIWKDGLPQDPALFLMK